MDFLLASIALILLAPVFIGITILLVFTNQGNPFFIQGRPGLNEKHFKLFKFKTMTDKVDAEGNLLADGDRLTALGKLLRKTSLDELPQLLNVVLGNMSLIGPRPLLPRYLPYYRGDEKLRHFIRPGITGWAQVNGRNKSNWDDRLAADVYYFENLSFRLDVLIFYRTIKAVLFAKNVVIDPGASMNPLDVEREDIKIHIN